MGILNASHAAIAAACIALATLTPSRAQSQAGGAEGKGSIEGRVIDASTLKPLPGITVGLAGSYQPSPTKTDAQGRFRFDGIPVRAIAVTVWPESGYVARPLMVNLEPVRNVTGIELKASKPPVVSGRVLDTRGRPVPGVMVALVRKGTAFGRYPPGRSLGGQTNDLGEYRVTATDPGDYTILVEPAPPAVQVKPLKDDEAMAPSPRTLAVVATYYPNSSSPDGAGSFRLGFGQVLEGMDVTLAREATMCIQSNVIERSDVSPIAVRVEEHRHFGARLVARGEVRGGGRFEVCGLQAGSYRLMAALAAGLPGARYALEAFTLTDSGVRLRDLLLQPLLPVRGRLTIDAEGDALPLPAPVTVLLQRIGRPGTIDERLVTRVAQEGPFTIPAVLPDEYWLTGIAPDGFYVKSATMAGADVWHGRLRAGGDELLMVLGQDGPTLSVRAVDEQSRPLANVTVILGRDPLPPSPAPDDLIARPADQNGQAVFTGIPPGDYRLLAYDDLWDEYAAMNPEFFLQHRLEGERVQLAAREKRAVQFEVLKLDKAN